MFLDLDPQPFKATLGGIGCSAAPVCVSANTDYNRLKALLGRPFRRSAVGPPLPGIYELCSVLIDVLLPGFRCEPMEVEEWLQSMPSRRRRALERALHIYEEGGWRAKYRTFKAFVKTEILPGFAKDGFGLVPLESFIDRLIMGPHDVTHIIAGPILKPLTRKLKEIWSPDGPIFYGSAGPEKLHKWLQRLVQARGLYVWCDYSMYDNTHSRESWSFLEGLYRKACRTNPDFWKVMDAWRQPAGWIGPFKFRTRIVNASGRDDTALANAILNGFAFYVSLCAAFLEIPVFEVDARVLYSLFDTLFISVCGDDSLGCVPLLPVDRKLRFMHALSRNVATFGFEAKLECSERLVDAVYLGSRPMPTRSGWFWGRTIGRATYKMGWVIDSGQDVLAHVTGIADMHVLCSSHVPVLSDLAKRIVELRQGAKRTPVPRDENRPWEWTYQSNLAYDDVTLEAVSAVYTRGAATTSVSEILDLISAIEKIPSLPFVLDHPVWTRMVLMDDL